jgi:predicted ATPase/DNA-binding SARP family transcriptional activator
VPPLRFGVLGPLAVWRDGEQVEVAGRRVRMLLALLLLDPGRPVPAGRLVDELWGEDPPADAANALQSLASRLRASLAADRLVDWRGGGYRLAVDPDAVDAHRFERLVREGRAAPPARAGAVLRSALELWRGEPLSGVGEPGFAEAAAARLRELRLSAVEGLAEAELACGRAAALVPELEALVAGHPLDERLRGLLMRALYASGRQADALALYERTRRAIGEELGVEPSAELQRLHLAMLRREPELEGGRGAGTDGEPSDAAVKGPPSGPPAQLTSFVGREDDLRRVAGLLRQRRLVTLTGPGGAGKTRLALEVAGTAPAAWEGVCVVELAPLRDPADVPEALLAALGLREASLVERQGRRSTDPLQRLLGALASSRALLVVDNCEHLVAEVARLLDAVLARCPSVRVLATSREPLGVAGEALHPLAPLALPPDTLASDAGSYAAVRLFCDRAAAVRPGFGLDAANVVVVVQVCRRLDGLPLAIELAAARLRSLSVEEVAARLDDRFGLLTAGSRTALPRHQTLRAVVDWSWDLLESPERALLRRLSVFSGGATVESAEHVCAAGEVRVAEVLDLLASLVDKSLLEAAETPGGTTRYRLLQTMRAYGLERLAEAGEGEALARRHAEFLCELAERADRELRGRDQLAWIARVDAEHDNFRAALRWALDAGEASLAVRLANRLSWYWAVRGFRAESHRWVSAALALPGEVDPAERADALTTNAFGLVERANYQGAVDAMESARGLYDRSGRRPGSRFLTVQPLLAAFGGDAELGRAEAARLLADPGLDAWTRAGILLNLGQLETFDGQVRGAAQHYREAAEHFRSLEERWGLVQALEELADFAEQRGDYPEAETALREAEERAEELGAREDMAGLAVRQGVVRMLTGDGERGAADVERGLRLAGELGSRETLLSARATLGNLARQRGDLPEARRTLEDGLRLAPSGAEIPPFRVILLILLGMVAEEEGDAAQALALQREAVDQITDSDLPFRLPWERILLAGALVGLAGACALAGDPERAAVLLGAVTTLRGDTPMSPSERRDQDRIAGRARRALGDERYRRAHQRGAAMSYREAVDYVRRR